jgi:murein DD-endopeptidase MepM/ murein hydrolase activator NlpD
MKQLFCIAFSFLMSQTTFCQIPDSTIEKAFKNHRPDQILRLIQLNENLIQDETLKKYIIELTFRIPILNPIANQRITSKFGYRIHPIMGQIKKHQGIDIEGLRSQKVYAAADGVIVEIGYQHFLGNYVKIKHLLGYETIYGHLEEFIVEPNAQVYQGQIIGYCGSTGRTTGVHLHFSIIWLGSFLNPYSFIF